LVKNRFIKNRANKEIPEIEILKGIPSLTNIAAIVQKTVKDNKLSRKIAIYLSRKYTAKTLDEIASFYGNIGDTEVSQLCIRLEQKREKDQKLNKLISRLEKEISVSYGDLTLFYFEKV